MTHPTPNQSSTNIQSYDNDNAFAKIIRGEIPNHTVYEDEKTLAFMDIMPVAKGHVLVIPKYEAVELSEMPAEYLQAVFTTAQKVMEAQRKVLNRQGIVQLQLNHKQAGQSVFHYHIHLIPANIKDIGQHELKMADHNELSSLADQLKKAL